MEPMIYIFFGAALIIIFFLVKRVLKKGKINKPPEVLSVSQDIYWRVEEETLLKQINIYRKENNLPFLQQTDDLYRLAGIRVKKWIKLGYNENDNFHNFFFQDRQPYMDKGYINISENASYKYKYVFYAWKKSEGHNNNILTKDWKYAGISIKYNSDGIKYVCLVLGK